ncbi:DUF7467 domain-containing protein [Arenibacter latericius]|uniref:DUF7467 domain-containing protein n=1 Tax=Arenibacter latericius TaxID=86104 RepID=UPI0004116007|nr:hypothetical protein [Arenibacter latericius]
MKKITTLLMVVTFVFLSCETDPIKSDAVDAVNATSKSLNTDNCTVDLFPDLPELVNACAEAKPGSKSYLDLVIADGSLAGDYAAWCIDVARTLNAGDCFEANVFNSYEPVPAGVVDKPENFDLINWILNQDFVGELSENGVDAYTIGDVQWAMWELIDDANCIACTYLQPYNVGRANEIISFAIANGKGYKPGGGDVLAVVLQPTDGKQVVIIPYNIECEPEIPCDPCDGKVTELTLKNNGDGANVKVVQKKDDVVVFDEYVDAGATFSFSGKDKKGTLGTEIIIYVDNDEHTRIHTSCSKPIGPGLISGDFEVIRGASLKGGELCPVDTPPGGGDCGECEGKVTKLTLQNNGIDANIKVVQKKDDLVVFDEFVSSGAQFSFSGVDKKGTLGTEIIIYINEVEHTRIHTSCSKPIGPGFISGDFEVVGGASLKGGELCPVDTPPGGGDCGECDGKVTKLTLQNNGSDAIIKVVQKKDEVSIFDGFVSSESSFSFTGKDKNRTLGTEIIIYVNGAEHTRIHTSCSKPIGPGLISGDFEVVGGASLKGGDLCPVDTPPVGGDCGECDGKVTKLTLLNNGNIASIRVAQKKDDITVYQGKVANGASFSFSGLDKNGTLGTEIIIYVDGKEHVRVHTSCSKPIGTGLKIGDFVVVGGASLKGGELCPVDVPSVPPSNEDCGECEGKATNLILQNKGGQALVRVEQKDGDVVFEATVASGGSFNFSGTDKNGTLGTEITIYVNGVKHTSIHTSCSKPLGPGLVSGDFKVLGGASLKGGEFCPL